MLTEAKERFEEALGSESENVKDEAAWKEFRDRWMARKNGLLTQINELWLKGKRCNNNGVVPRKLRHLRRSPGFASPALSTAAAVTKSKRSSVCTSPRFAELSTPSKPKCSSKPGVVAHSTGSSPARAFGTNTAGSISVSKVPLLRASTTDAVDLTTGDRGPREFADARARQAMSSSTRCSSAGRTGTCRPVLFAEIRDLFSLGHTWWQLVEIQGLTAP